MELDDVKACTAYVARGLVAPYAVECGDPAVQEVERDGYRCERHKIQLRDLSPQTLKGKLIIYIVQVEDLTRLGGPMGTEQTYHLYFKPFFKLKSAKEWCEKKCKGRHMGWTNPIKGESKIWYLDAYGIGFQITKHVVE